jgi:diadenosine tetraphosphatase ApaH/serine/threonine PP2A family protein phosphatase
MRWAILSDIHGNLESFRAVIEDLREEKVDRVAFLGDVMGYGADPNDCLALLEGLTDWVVAGNHDYGSVGLTDIDVFNHSARSAILWTRDQLLPESRNYLRRLLLRRQIGEITFVHASPNHPEDWNYIFTFPEAEEAFQALTGRLAFIGHSHRPLILAKEKDSEVRIIHHQEAVLESGIRYIINVGSVGQPRDGHPEAAYGIYDETGKMYRLKRVGYDVATAQKKIIKAGLPPFLAQRLSRGI